MSYANLSAAREKPTRDGKVNSFKMDAVKLYKGGCVLRTAAGYATYVVAASQPFLGVAIETIDNSAGSAGDKSIRCAAEGVFSFVAASMTIANIGDEVYWDDGSSGTPGQVVTSDPGCGPKVGRIVEVVSATEVMVRINGYALVQASQAS